MAAETRLKVTAAWEGELEAAYQAAVERWLAEPEAARAASVTHAHCGKLGQRLNLLYTSLASTSLSQRWDRRSLSGAEGNCQGAHQGIRPAPKLGDG